jgi:hypothetical protein
MYENRMRNIGKNLKNRLTNFEGDGPFANSEDLAELRKTIQSGGYAIGLNQDSKINNSDGNLLFIIGISKIGGDDVIGGAT